MSDKSRTPTGVFVRLPLSDAQVLSVLDSYTGDRETTIDAMQKAICDLGTPFAGEEVSKLLHNIISAGIRKALKINWAGGVFAMHAEADSLAQETMSEMPHTQAALAAAQAEIVRLREYLTSCTANLENVMTKMGDWCGENGPPEYLGPEEVMSAMDAYETGKEALKGPEA